MKRAGLHLLLLCVLASIAVAQSLTAHIEGEQLHIASSRVHFLTGEALQRLRDGATVNYQFDLTARPDRAVKALSRSVERFAVSYDLWEEKFAVTKLGSAPKSVSHLSAAAAEAWCVGNVSMPSGVLPAKDSFWIRLDYRAEEPGGTGEQADNSSFSLSNLVDIFSRRTREEQVHGSEEIGPLRLADLKKR